MSNAEIGGSNYDPDYGRIALALVLILIFLLIISHIGFSPSAQINYYSCPGIGIQSNIDSF